MSDEGKETRSSSIRVRLTPTNLDRLERLSKRLGIPAPTLLALFAGQGLDEQWSRIYRLEEMHQGDFYVDEEGHPLIGDDGHPLRRDEV